VNLAVGDTQVVQWVNVSYAVFNKTTGAVIAGPIAGNQFWAGFGGPCETSNSGDIIVQWDKIAHRWVMTQNVFSAPYHTCIAISQTADATGPYYRFQFPQSGFPITRNGVSRPTPITKARTTSGRPEAHTSEPPRAPMSEPRCW